MKGTSEMTGEELEVSIAWARRGRLRWIGRYWWPFFVAWPIAMAIGISDTSGPDRYVRVVGWVTVAGSLAMSGRALLRARATHRAVVEAGVSLDRLEQALVGVGMDPGAARAARRAAAGRAPELVEAIMAEHGVRASRSSAQ